VEGKLNFSQISALVVDGDRYSTGIIGQILRGFGLAHHNVVGTVEEAKKLLATGRFHLLITETNLADSTLADFVAWIRRSPENALRYIPIVVLSGYTFYSRVTVARDSGVNSVVRKPVSPAVLFDHIAWSARIDRPFIDADAYAGPCRRFRFGDPAPGFSRRVSDHPPDVLADSADGMMH
jgi:two-component system, chemotaxis family, chemotaxis protein CheY